HPHNDRRGQFRLYTELDFPPRYLAQLLARFAERHKQLRVDVQAEDRFVNIPEPRFAMALRMGRLDDSCLVARPITANRHRHCASPDYLSLHGVPQHPEELKAHDGLVDYNREPGARTFEQLVPGGGAHPHPDAERGPFTVHQQTQHAAGL
ncbi:LysR substrate-binding domain-containing protein, partial [Pseudomonas aeruginosa]